MRNFLKYLFQPHSRITVGEYLQTWLAGKELSRRPKTVALYRNTIDKHITPNLGDIHLVDLQPGQVRLFYAQMKRNGTGDRTLQAIHDVLRNALGQAEQEGLIPRNPVDTIDRPDYQAEERPALGERQAAQLLIAAESTRHPVLYWIALMGGLREGEILGLRWSDVDWEVGCLSIRRQVQRLPGKGIQFVTVKTRAGQRKVRLGALTLRKLLEHRTNQDRKKLEIGKLWQENDLIFPSTTGSLWEQRKLLREFKRLLSDAGLPDIHFHDLRHTSITLALKAGIDIPTVAKRAGHSKPSVTSDIYGHATTEAEERAAEILEQVIAPISLDHT